MAAGLTLAVAEMQPPAEPHRFEQPFIAPREDAQSRKLQNHHCRVGDIVGGILDADKGLGVRLEQLLDQAGVIGTPVSRGM